MQKKREKSLFETHNVRSNNTISYVISTHLLIEHLLIKGISAKLTYPDALFEPRTPNFSVLISLAEALGVLEKDFIIVLRRLNTLRNKYAHKLSFNPNSEEVVLLQKELREMKAPFLISLMPPTEHEFTLMMAAIAGYTERSIKQLISAQKLH